MREPTVDNLSAQTRRISAAGRHNSGNGELPDFEQFAETVQPQPDLPLPYLEDAMVAAKKYPYAMLTIIVSVVGIIVGSGVVLSIAIIGSVFSMSNTMHEVKAQQVTILQQLAKTQTDVDNMGTAMRAYEAANGKRTEYQIGLMTRDQQRSMNDYDQSHPLPRMPRERNQ